MEREEERPTEREIKKERDVEENGRVTKTMDRDRQGKEERDGEIYT